MTSQQYLLARPIPARLIERAPQGDYVPHFVIVQAIIAAVGQYDWELVEVLRQDVAAHHDQDGNETHPPLPSAVVGAVYRMRVKIDGREHTVEEAGSCGAGAWERNDGERLKKAASDALKRCGMRLGVALHLWCKRHDQFFLPRLLAGDDDDRNEDEVLVGVEGDDEAPVTDPKAAEAMLEAFGAMPAAELGAKTITDLTALLGAVWDEIEERGWSNRDDELALWASEAGLDEPPVSLAQLGRKESWVGFARWTHALVAERVDT